MPTLYGADAMGGGVNLITRKVSPAWSGSVTLGGTLQEDRTSGDSGQGTRPTLGTPRHVLNATISNRLDRDFVA